MNRKQRLVVILALAACVALGALIPIIEARPGPVYRGPAPATPEIVPLDPALSHLL